MGIPQCEHTETVLCRWICQVRQSMGLRSPIEADSPISKDTSAVFAHMQDLPVCTRDAVTPALPVHRERSQLEGEGESEPLVSEIANNRSESSTLLGTTYGTGYMDSNIDACGRGGEGTDPSFCPSLPVGSADASAAAASDGHIQNSASAHDVAAESAPEGSMKADVVCAALSLGARGFDCGRENLASDQDSDAHTNILTGARNQRQCNVSVDVEGAACVLSSGAQDFPDRPSSCPGASMDTAETDFGLASICNVGENDSAPAPACASGTDSLVAGMGQSFISVDAEYVAPSSSFNVKDLDINAAAFQDDNSHSPNSVQASPRNRFSSFDLVDLDSNSPMPAENTNQSYPSVGLDCADSGAAADTDEDNHHSRLGGIDARSPGQSFDSLDDEHAAPRNRFCSFDIVDLDSSNAVAAKNSCQSSPSITLTIQDCAESSIAVVPHKEDYLSKLVDDAVEDESTDQGVVSPDPDHGGQRSSSFDLVDLESNNQVVADNASQSSASVSVDCATATGEVVENATCSSPTVDGIDTDPMAHPVTLLGQACGETYVRHIFLVRHVQSQWNVMMKAFKDVDIRGMYDSATAVEGVDHPLSEEGLRQAEELQNKIHSWRAMPDPIGVPADSACSEPDRVQAFYEAFYLAKDSEILCSPQRRALQTADRTLPVADGWPSIKLIREARELKRHMFEYDNVSTEDNIGEQIVVNAGLASHADRIDSSECTDRWWPEGVDSDDQREVRAKALWRRLEELESSSCIVVTHSNLIKQLANFIIRSQILDREVDACGSDQWDFCIVPKIPEDLERARSSKLRNGGVLGLQCRFEMPAPDCPGAQASLTVEDALLMFESGFEDVPSTAAANA